MTSDDHSPDPKDVTAAAERVIVSCDQLASDVVDLARQSPIFDEHQTRFMVRS